MIRVRHLVIALGLAACTVHGSGSMAVETTGVVYQEPPPPQVETVEVRPGFVWIKGRYNWQNGQWAWVGGHWERERAGYVWTDGRWEHRGNQWVWVEGSWAVSSQPAATVTVVTPPPAPGPEVRDHREPVGVVSGGVTVSVGAYPTAAPPPVQVENPGVKAGFVWVAGHWNWTNGNWAWQPGHWERERANMMWTAGRWELQGNRYVWIEGKWEAGAAVGPTVRDHRH